MTAMGEMRKIDGEKRRDRKRDGNLALDLGVNIPRSLDEKTRRLHSWAAARRTQEQERDCQYQGLWAGSCREMRWRHSRAGTNGKDVCEHDESRVGQRLGRNM